MLLDTDVLIDVALDRYPHSESSTELLDRVERGVGRAFVAWHTLSNLYYLVTPARGNADTRDFIAELVRFVSVAPADTLALRYAVSLPIPDFEDAMQVAAARACGAEHIVTRNVRDFRRSPIPAMTPGEALLRLF
ncbi:MAG: PIN domain-containing protein [Rhodospirillaceae bacterium]|nr:PIN domain-containing protein [Rhodospirillaceae bacterium]MDE0360150.1 PIN domain-containing protein [Rhodospirillaceae bacterium]